MEKQATSDGEPVTAHYVARVMAELTFDLQRAVKSGVPAALSVAAADLEPERRATIARCIIDEIGARYEANAMATIITIGP